MIKMTYWLALALVVVAAVAVTTGRSVLAVVTLVLAGLVVLATPR